MPRLTRKKTKTQKRAGKVQESILVLGDKYIGRIKVITGIRFGIPTVRSPQQIQLHVE
jgi:hypothetical protein